MVNNATMTVLTLLDFCRRLYNVVCGCEKTGGTLSSIDSNDSCSGVENIVVSGEFSCGIVVSGVMLYSSVGGVAVLFCFSDFFVMFIHFNILLVVKKCTEKRWRMTFICYYMT